ncbi:MAG: hypothetical protein ACRC7N_20810 [Clostridium sp.]
MKCYIHTDRDAVAMCTTCNSVICEECRVMINGKNVCKRCLEHSHNQNFDSNNNSNQTYSTNTNESFNSPPKVNKNLSLDVNITKLLVWISIIFSVINIFNFLFLASKDIFSLIPFFNNMSINISFILYDVLFLLGFLLLLGVNLSKVTNFPLVNNNNIGALTMLSIALMGLGVIIVTVFANGPISLGNVFGLSALLDNLFTNPIWLAPVTCTLVTIFGIYKHKININITY